MLSVAAFVENFARPGRPVLIRRGCSSWDAVSTWTEEFLLDALQPLGMNTSQYFVRKIEASSGNLVLSEPDEIHDTEHLIYSFQGNAWKGGFRPLDFVTTLPWFGSQHFEPFEHFFSMGNTDSGLFFHKHGPAWNALVLGRKRWMLLPANSSMQPPPISYKDSLGKRKWREEVLPSLPIQERPQMCVQDAGDVLYIPEQWLHAVQNVGRLTVAINALVPDSSCSTGSSNQKTAQQLAKLLAL